MNNHNSITCTSLTRLMHVNCLSQPAKLQISSDCVLPLLWYGDEKPHVSGAQSWS